MTVLEAQATYLIWLDVSRITSDSAKLAQVIRAKTGLFLSAGDVYRGDGNRFLRMNIACPTAELTDGLARLKRGIEGYLVDNKG